MLTATPRQVRGNAEGAMPSPDGSLIAFRSSVGEPQIWVMSTSGEDARLLATAALQENFGQLQWSPDGKRIGVIVHRVGETDSAVDAVEVADGRRSEVLRRQSLRSFVWLADGRMILAGNDPQNSGSSYLREVDARGRERLIEIGSGNTVADISATADGHQLVLVRANEQSDVYGAALGKNSLGESKRLTLDERDDRPTAWLPDGKYFLFESNRNGSLDIFRQSVDSPVAEQIISGGDDQFGAQLSPDGSSLLYWSAVGSDKPLRLMRMPLAGGSAETVLESPVNSQFRCAATCILAEATSANAVTLSSFDPRNGVKTKLRGITAKEPTKGLLFATAKDGTQIAYGDASGVTVLDLRSGDTWSVPQDSFTGAITGIAAGQGAAEWIVTTTSSRENPVTLVTAKGVKNLATMKRPVAAPVFSPDGKHLLIRVTSASSNAWLVDNL